MERCSSLEVVGIHVERTDSTGAPLRDYVPVMARPSMSAASQLAFVRGMLAHVFTWPAGTLKAGSRGVILGLGFRVFRNIGAIQEHNQGNVDGLKV